MTDDDRPVAARRKRGISTGPNLRSRNNATASKSGCHSMSTLPATPKRGISTGPNLRSRNNSTASKSGCHSMSTLPATPKRGISTGPNLRSRNNATASKSGCHSMSTLSATPKRGKKRVRFSEPSSETDLESASSGLTPFILRTTLSSTPPPAGHHIPPAALQNCGNYSTPISGTIQFEPLRQGLDGRVKRRLRRNGLSEEANNIKWENSREVKLLRTEIERLRRELEAKCIEVQSIRDMQDLDGQEESRGSITTNMELTARVQELEQQVADLRAELEQKEVESEGDEDADSVAALRDLPSLDEDNCRVITNDDLEETQTNGDKISAPTGLDTSFPSPPPTMPNTPCKNLSSMNAQVPASIPNADSANEALQNQLQSELELREIGLTSHTAKTAHSSLVRPRKEKSRKVTRERRQGRRWMWDLVPYVPSSSPNTSEH